MSTAVSARRRAWDYLLATLGIVVCVVVGTFVLHRLEDKGPFRKLNPWELEYNRSTRLTWDRHDSGWSDQDLWWFASIGGEFAVILLAPPAQDGDGDRERVGIVIFDATGQPFFEDHVLVPDGVAWAMSWDTEVRLWFITEAGPVSFWQWSEEGGFVSNPYVEGASPAAPVVER